MSMFFSPIHPVDFHRVLHRVQLRCRRPASTTPPILPRIATLVSRRRPPKRISSLPLLHASPGCEEMVTRYKTTKTTPQCKKKSKLKTAKVPLLCNLCDFTSMREVRVVDVLLIFPFVCTTIMHRFRGKRSGVVLVIPLIFLHVVQFSEGKSVGACGCFWS
jgi:hypothetical protein